MLHRIFTTTLVLLWFSVANHCVVSATFASPAKAAHHCGPKGAEAPAGPHDNCTKRVCCELFSPMTGDLDVSPRLTAVVLVNPILSAILADIGRTASLWLTAHPPAVGPPLARLTLLGSLALAQNAPPR